MADYDDFLDFSDAPALRQGYPARKQKKEKNTQQDDSRKKKEKREIPVSSGVELTYNSPRNSEEKTSSLEESISKDAEYGKFLSKINNYALVDFEIYLRIEKKEKQKFKTGTRNNFLKYIATFHQDELKAKGFSERAVKNMKDDAVIDNGYSVHHKFPRYFAEKMGIEYNNFQNLILVRENNERGDEDIHAYMDKQLRKAIEIAKNDRSIKPAIQNETSFGKYLKREDKTFKMTIPWPVGAVYLTEEQQKEFEKIKKSKGQAADFSEQSLIAKATSEIIEVSQNYKERSINDNFAPHLKNARISYEDSGKTILLANSSSQLRTSSKKNLLEIIRSQRLSHLK